MSLKDNAYQKNVAQKKIDNLTSFLEDIQCLRGIKQPRSSKTLDRMLLEAEVDKEINTDDQGEINIDDTPETDETPEQQDKVAAVADQKEKAAADGKLYLGANQRYFMGAGQEPLLTIITSVGEDKIKYYQYPWKKEQVIKKDIGQNLLRKGSETWLQKNSETTEEDLKRSIEAVLAGKPGEKVTLEDYQFSNIQVRYTGSEKGDEKPWEELENKFNVNVSGVLANKQTYNIRLTNRALQKFEDELRQAEPEERNFKIVKIMKEEEDFAYMVECVGIYKNPYAAKPKVIIKEVPAEEMEWLTRMVELGIRNSVTYGDYKVGDCVVYNDIHWNIAEFIPWMKDPAAMLVSIDKTTMADQVPLKKIRKMTPEEISGQKSREQIVKGMKELTLDFPKSENCGCTQDIVKEVKGKKSKGTLKESLFEDKVEDLADFIDNDPDTYKKDFAPAAKNLTNKWNEGSYNKELALRSFKQIAESASKRFFIANDGEYEGKNYSDPKQMFPEDIVEKVALVLRKSFENQANAGVIKEAIERICEGKNKKPTDQEAYDQGRMVGPTSDRGSDQTDIDSPTIGGPIEEQKDNYKEFSYGLTHIQYNKDKIILSHNGNMGNTVPSVMKDLTKFYQELSNKKGPEDRERVKILKIILNSKPVKEKGSPDYSYYAVYKNVVTEESAAPDSDDQSEVMKGQTSTVKENIPFTENERSALKEASSKVKIEILNNAANLSWDGAEGLVKITIAKIPQPQQKNFVYTATAKIDGELDKERTINSDSFETEDDVDILKSFLSQLKLNEEMDESERYMRQLASRESKKRFLKNLPKKFNAFKNKKIQSEPIPQTKMKIPTQVPLKLAKAELKDIEQAFAQTEKENKILLNNLNGPTKIFKSMPHSKDLDAAGFGHGKDKWYMFMTKIRDGKEDGIRFGDPQRFYRFNNGEHLAFIRDTESKRSGEYGHAFVVTKDGTYIPARLWIKQQIASKNINEEKQIWGEPVKHIKYVNQYPIRDEKPIKSEVIGNVRFIYKLAKDIKHVKAGEVSSKKKKKSKKKYHKHKTKVKLVSAYPIIDGKPVHSHTVGNITYRYKTKQDKKTEAEKRKAERKRKGKSKKYNEETITLISADKDVAIISINGEQQKIKRFQLIESQDSKWVYKEFLTPVETESDKSGIIIIDYSDSVTAPIKVQTIMVGETLNI